MFLQPFSKTFFFTLTLSILHNLNLMNKISTIPEGSSRNSTVNDNFLVLCKESPYNATRTPQTRAHYRLNILYQFHHIRISSHEIQHAGITHHSILWNIEYENMGLISGHLDLKFRIWDLITVCLFSQYYHWLGTWVGRDECFLNSIDNITLSQRSRTSHFCWTLECSGMLASSLAPVSVSWTRGYCYL